MSAIAGNTTREEFAAIVVEQLRRVQIEVVLVGGSVAAIYSSEKYVTYDLDLVSWARLSEIAKSLSGLGFTMTGRLASHPQSKFTLDFVSSPVAIGHKFIADELLVTRTTPLGSFRLLSPVDCVLDRLSAFYYFDDRQGLEQAVAIAQVQNVRVDEIERWSREEARQQGGKPSLFDDRFSEFVQLLNTLRLPTK